jgi:hypothetical protein
MQQRKFYHLGQDQEGRPVVYISFRAFLDGGAYDVDEVLDAYIYMIEQSVLPSMRDTSDGTWTVLIDVHGVNGPSSVPMSFLGKFNTVFESNYPERLHKTVIFPVPWIVQRITTGVLRRFVDPVTRAKFAFVSEMSQLVEGSGVAESDLLAASDEIQELLAAGQLGKAAT